MHTLIAWRLKVSREKHLACRNEISSIIFVTFGYLLDLKTF